MKRPRLRRLALCLLVLAGWQITLAQTFTIKSTVYKDKIRFESLEQIKEFRAEVFSVSGQKVFDSGFVADKTIDWNMLDQEGQPVADGVYDYLVTTKKRSGTETGVQAAQLSILREGQDLENAPALVQPAASGSGNGSGNVTGTGTAGQITRWTGTTTLGDSSLIDKDGKIGLGTTNPVSLLHILGSQPVTSTLTGTNATEGLRIIGGKGGDTSGSGQTAGNGANLVMQAGDGGDALTGTSGRGGYVTIQPGAAGIGSLSGRFGQVLLAPGGGNVGIGVTDAASKLTVAGMIETTLGGLKFPDGTTQTTAAVEGLASVFHDATLNGNGTSGSPLGVADGEIGTTQLASGAVTAEKIAAGQVVTSLNGLRDGVSLDAGANITITSMANGLTIAAPNSLTTVAHDTTLTGNGTAASPLAVAPHLTLTGAIASGPVIDAVIKATNTANGDALAAIGGDDTTSGGFGGAAVVALGGAGDFVGGSGVQTTGGNSNSGGGGPGVEARGGHSNSGDGGFGVIGEGGDSDSNFGGTGVSATGGLGSGTFKSGGVGISASAGRGINGATDGLAGIFFGDVQISGNLSKGGGSFKIDHPLDPENKYLYHSFVESPDMKNIYDGVVKLDSNGESTVELPEWFGALNRDFRYLLTAIGAPAPNLHIAEEISNNRFKIAGGTPGMKVSWQVTGIRHDAYANKHRIPIEEDKSEGERGSYLHPDAFNQPEERGIEWARDPQRMQRLKLRRIQTEQKLKQQQ